MPEKRDERICAYRARYGIIAHHSPAAARDDWTLAPTPTQFEYGNLLRSHQSSRQLCPLPAPVTNWQEPLALCPFFLIGAVRGNA